MKKVLRFQRCPKCEAEGRDRSGNNLAVYTDHSYCYAGHGFINETHSEYEIEAAPLVDTSSYTKLRSSASDEVTYQYVPTRGISRETMEFYGVHTKVGADGQPLSIGLPYGSFTVVRTVLDRSFKAIGDSTDVKLFGQDRFNSGEANAITVTEGAIDAMSVFEALGRKYPAVGVRSASSAKGDCERAWHYLNSFEKIYLCFDSDAPGVAASTEVARLFDSTKVYHVKLDKWKDANEALQDNPEMLRKVWYNAKRYQPKGIVSTYEEFEAAFTEEDKAAVASYPFPTIDKMSYGIRTGELVLFTALEKVGKTEVLRAIEYHLLKTTDHNIGIIHLEEKYKRALQGLVGYELNVPTHLPDSGVSVADKIQAVKTITKRDDRLHFYSHFGSDDPDRILDIIRHLVGVCHCKFVFLDHITMLVTGFEGDDERKKLDYLSTRLAMLTRELDFTLFMVSHVNDEGQTRGSRNIGKVADLLLHLDRNIEAQDEATRNTTRVTCRGNRFGSITGPAGLLEFDPKSFTVKEKDNGMSILHNA